MAVPPLGETTDRPWEPSASTVVASPRGLNAMGTPAQLAPYRSDPPPSKRDKLRSARRKPPPPLLQSNLDQQPDSARRAVPEGEELIDSAVHEEFAKFLPSWR